jgi:hypothetical protein
MQALQFFNLVIAFAETFTNSKNRVVKGCKQLVRIFLQNHLGFKICYQKYSFRGPEETTVFWTSVVDPDPGSQTNTDSDQDLGHKK